MPSSATGADARPADGLGAERLPRPARKPARGLIARRRVVDRIRGWSGYPIVLAVAPAGYGKSTALAEWDDADPRPFAWLTLDARDNDPAFLVRSIAAALDAIEPVDPRVFDALVVARPGISYAVLPRLVASIAQRKTPFVLVLDDLHLVEDPDALEIVAAIGTHLPAGSQLAIATRREPEMKAGSLRAQGQLVDLDARALSMTQSEIAAVAAGFGLDLGGRATSQLAERTEGWPVAVYVAARALEADSGPEGAGSFTGEDRLMADYLRDELVETLAPDDRRFLVECSILDRLTGEACDALLEGDGSAETLRRLSRDNLLVIPLDRSDRDYRYHALFREMLAGELRRTAPQREAELHTRAAGWYWARGDADRAVEHAIQSGDTVAAGALIWAMAGEYASRGRDATMRRLLGRFTEAELLANPTLALAAATSALMAGDGARIEQLTRAACDHLDAAPAELREGLEAGARLIAASGSTTGELAGMREAAVSVRPLLDPESAYVSLAYFVEGLVAHLMGAREDAVAALEEGARRGGVGAPSIRCLCLSQLTLLALETGEETRAWELEEQVGGLLDRYGLGDFGTQALGLAVGALVRARRGRASEAAVAARRTAALLAQLPGTSACYEAETRIVLADALLHLDDAPGATRLLREAERYVELTPDGPVLREMHERVTAAAENASASGRWPLTPAELRLLHLLPTHHSFREIAEQLFVSTNTVKSQARSIYTKLGVASRAEAVAAAQGAGLVPGADGDGTPRAAGSRSIER